jgi:hypothetical protein
MRKSLLKHRDDPDPAAGVLNLFDIAMVFSVALMVAMVGHFKLTEIFSKEDFTIVKNPGKENMEIIMKREGKIERYEASDEQNKAGTGKRIGTAYQLENGEIIYVPD